MSVEHKVAKNILNLHKNIINFFQNSIYKLVDGILLWNVWVLTSSVNIHYWSSNSRDLISKIIVNYLYFNIAPCHKLPLMSEFSRAEDAHLLTIISQNVSLCSSMSSILCV